MNDRRKSHAQLLVQTSTRRDLEELLRELYVAKRHSQQEIADALTAQIRSIDPDATISRSAVKLWLGEYRITRDDRPAVAL